MRVFIDKPKNLAGKAKGSFQTSTTTYSDSSVTYSSSSVQYGGFYGYADPGPTNISVDYQLPTNRQVKVEKPK